MPEVGPAPDMINDDLPTNLEYLDESFGAAAGLRELSDDEFDIEETGLNTAAGSSVSGLVSRVGGETIKMLRPEGIRILDNFFDTLAIETAGETAACVSSALVVTVASRLTHLWTAWAKRLSICKSTVGISHYSSTMGMTGQKPGKRLQRKSRRCGVA